MKKYIIILIFIFSFNQKLGAECSYETYYLTLPENFEIATNSLFLINGYLGYHILNDLDKNYTVYLKSNKDSVKLSLIKSNKSYRLLSQVLLKPERYLLQSEIYHLYIDVKGSNTNIYKSSNNWKIKNILDFEKPQIFKKTKYLYKTITYFGCGPSAQVVFKTCINDFSVLLVDVKLKDLETGLVSEYILPINDRCISVGYNMCSGEFFLAANRKYEVSFIYMDFAGNKTIDKNKYYFTAPNKDDTFSKYNNAIEENLNYCDCENSNYYYIHQNITLIIISILLVLMLLLFKYI